MNSSNILNFYNLFHFCCITATIGTASWCFYKYSLNNDLTDFSFIQFNTDQKSIYPSISLCDFDPCLDEKLSKFSNNSTCEDYYNIHNQNTGFHKEFPQIDYDNFTVDLEKYLIRTEIVLLNGTKIGHPALGYNIDSGMLRPPYRGITEPTIKCYTFDVPYYQGTTFSHYAIHLNESFPYLSRTYIAVHYPNQLNQGNLAIQFLGKELDFNRNATRNEVHVQISSITAILRRNKPDSQCNKEWDQADLVLMEEQANKLNCRHPHVNTSHHLPSCSQVSELSRFSWKHSRNSTPPCIAIIDSNIDIKWDSALSTDDTNINVKVSFLMNGKFKQISQVI